MKTFSVMANIAFLTCVVNAAPAASGTGTVNTWPNTGLVGSTVFTPITLGVCTNLKSGAIKSFATTTTLQKSTCALFTGPNCSGAANFIFVNDASGSTFPGSFVTLGQGADSFKGITGTSNSVICSNQG